METIIVAIVVGAFSGLLGSIAGPFLAHRLDRRRREELRQEEKNRELRRMLEELMPLARSACSTTLEIQYVDTVGGDVQQVIETSIQEAVRFQASHPEYLWRPQRIADETLRRLAIGLLHAQGQLHLLIGARRGTGLALGSLRNWPEQVQNVRRWVDMLMDAVDRRMDELGW